MPKRLTKDFKPSEQTYINLAKHGAVREFVDYELEMFMAYFLDPDLPDSKAKKSSWQMTCQRWMRQAWKGKSGRDWEYERHNRSKFDTGGFKSMNDAYGKLISGKPETLPKPARKYKLPERPQVSLGPTDALEALKLAKQSLRG